MMQDPEYRIDDAEFRNQDKSSRIQNTGYMMQDSEYRIDDAGSRIQDR